MLLAKSYLKRADLGKTTVSYLAKSHSKFIDLAIKI